MKRVLSVVLSLAILLGAFSAVGFNASAEEDANTANCDDILARYVNMDAFTSTLSSGLIQCNTSIDISGYNIPYSTNNWYALYYYVKFQLSEFCNVYSLGYTYNYSKFLSLSVSYNANYNTPQKFAPIYQQFIAARDEILSGIEGNNALSDVQKSLLVHDRVVSRTAYDYTNYLNDTIPNEDYQIAGVLIYKKAVCSGYAAVYAYLMNRLNIDTVTISSNLCNHAWNKTKVEGKWYYVDCTWDDNVHDGVGYVEHDNFLRSAQGLKDTGHIKNGQVDWDDSANNTEYDNYYWRNSYAEFQYINGKFYYIDCVSKTLNIADENHTALCSVSDSYYAALRNYNNKLLFNSKTDVYQYNLSSKIKSKILTPDVKKFGEKFLISGFTTKNEILYIYAYENGYRHSCPLEQRDNYLITCNYNELNFEVQHNFSNNVCTNCGKKNFEYKIENGGAVITGYNGNYFDTEITIPQRLGGYPVTEIGEKAFYQNEEIKKVNFPDTLTKISNYAFYYCSALENVQLSKNLIEIGHYAFAYCPLKELVFPDSVKTIYRYVVYGSKTLKRVYVGSGANNIYGGAFAACKSLESITVSPQNTVYDSRDNCNAVILTDQNKIISGCKSTVIPVSVTSIGWDAFYWSGIINVTIPKSVTEIADYAFGNSDLATVTYLGTQQQWANIKIGENNDPLTNAQITYKPCAAHSYNSGVVTTQPTCTKKGIKTFTCTVCGNTKTQDVSATGVHIYVNGYCKDCDIEDKSYTVPTIVAPFNQNISVYNGRKYNAKFVPTKNGVIDFNSTGERDTAGCIYDSDMNCLAYNDDFNNDINFSLKLYVEQGKEYIVSAYVYGEKASGNFNLNLEYEKTAHTHDYTEQVISAPTCSEAGESKYTCTICNHTYTQAVPATGEHINIGGECIYCHTKDKNYVMPTITMPFSQSVKVCGNAKYYAKYTPQKDGTITFYSQGDVDSKGYIYDSNMNLLAENDDIFYEYGSENNNYNFKITYNLKAGKTYILACGSYFESPVDVLIKAEFKEHIHLYTNSVTKPTCTAQGYTTHTCSCGYSYVDSYTDTIAHNYLANVVAPRDNAVGYTQYKCSRCSALKKDEAGKVIKYNLTAPTGKPSGFKCASRTATAEKLTWTKTSGVNGYQVQLLNSAGKSAGTATTTGTAYTFSKLAAGHAYKARVRFFIKAADGKNYYGAWTTINSPTLPAGTSLVKVTGAKKAFTAQWKKGAVTGYQLQYATNNKFSGAKTVTVKKAATLKYTVKNLVAKKAYYVRVRTYKTMNKVNYYSAWSATKAVKTK